MIALHVGYKANIKAMHIAVQDFKGCGEKRGPWERKMAPIWPPVAPLLMAGAGNWEQSKLDGYSVGASDGERVSSFIWRGFVLETFLLLLLLLFVCLILPVPQHAPRQLDERRLHVECRIRLYRDLCCRIFSEKQQDRKYEQNYD